MTCPLGMHCADYPYGVYILPIALRFTSQLHTRLDNGHTSNNPDNNKLEQ